MSQVELFAELKNLLHRLGDCLHDTGAVSLTERRQLHPLLDALHEALLSQGVIHTDEPPVQMLAPCMKKTHRVYVWAYRTAPFSALRRWRMTSAQTVPASMRELPGRLERQAGLRRLRWL